MKIYHRGVPLIYPIPHDPDSTVWYSLIFDDALAGATITDGEFSITYPEGEGDGEPTLTIESSEIGVSGTYDGVEYDQICRVLLAGGTTGTKYLVACHVTTNRGEVLEKSFWLRVANN